MFHYFPVSAALVSFSPDVLLWRFAPGIPWFTFHGHVAFRNHTLMRLGPLWPLVALALPFSLLWISPSKSVQTALQSPSNKFKYNYGKRRVWKPCLVIDFERDLKLLRESSLLWWNWNTNSTIVYFSSELRCALYILNSLLTRMCFYPLDQNLAISPPAYSVLWRNPDTTLESSSDPDKSRPPPAFWGVPLIKGEPSGSPGWLWWKHFPALN